MNASLARLEARVEELVEGAFTRLFAGRLHSGEVVVQLARALEDHATTTPDGQRMAPTCYAIALHPADAEALLAATPDLATHLADQLIVCARELELVLPATPVVHLDSDESVKPHCIVITPTTEGQFPSETRQVTPITPQVPVRSDPPRAFLILDGSRHVPLERSVINLGRHLDNQVILDDARVSRHHAQLRRRYGRWVIYDLGSAAGTTVNGHSIRECVLRAGDVISLAGVQLIFGGEDASTEPSFQETGHTRPMRY